MFLVLGILFLGLLSPVVLADPPSAETDFEWEVRVPGRTIFSELTPVGKINLVHLGGQGGLLGKKGKETGEAIIVNANVAFVPADTIRYYAAELQLVQGSGELSTVILDANELLGLSNAMSYMLETAGNILDTDRAETRIFRRTKAGLTMRFIQQGKQQRFGVDFPSKEKQMLERDLEPEQYQSIRDLLDLTLYELRRQGAVIEQ